MPPAATGAERQAAHRARQKAELERLRAAVGAPPDAKATAAAPEPPRPAPPPPPRSQAAEEEIAALKAQVASVEADRRALASENMRLTHDLFHARSAAKPLSSSSTVKRLASKQYTTLAHALHPDKWRGNNRPTDEQLRDALMVLAALKPVPKK